MRSSDVVCAAQASMVVAQVFAWLENAVYLLSSLVWQSLDPVHPSFEGAQVQLQ